METAAARRAYVIAAKTDGENILVVAVRCPYCRGTHWHSWNHRDELGYRAPHCGTPGGGYWIAFPTPTTQENPMTDNPLADRIPSGAVVITPAADEDLEIGFGYIAETSQDVLYLTIRDPQKGPHVVLLAPELARDVAATLHTRCVNLDRLRTVQRSDQNGETHE